MKRKGFTLVELLIVISIISILLYFTVKVIGAVVSNARESATQVTIRKVQRLLFDRAEALQRLQKRSGYLETQGEYNSGTAVTLANGDINLQKILAKKLIYRKYFPVYAGEANSALNPNIGSGWTNGEILYEFLTQSGVVGAAPIGNDDFSTAEVRPSSINARPQFVDAWGNPLRFYRWPTRLFRPNPYWSSTTATHPIDVTNAKSLFSTLPSFSGNPDNDLSRDPDDPLRKCTVFNDFKTPANAPYDEHFEDVASNTFHTAATYHVLLVVSAGPDGMLGLYEPADTDNYGHLAAVADAAALQDDITFLNVRAGGR